MPNDRRQQILDWLTRDKSASLDELGAALHYSRSTIRRDVLELEEMGLVQRGRGRVELLVTSSKERHHLLRAGERVEEKRRIAALAADFVSDGMALFLDASTTVRQVCPLLRPFQHLTVVTNGLETAQAVTRMPHIGLFFTGGYWRDDTGSFVGEPAVDFVRRLRLDLCLLSCCGMDGDGLYEASLQQAYVKQAMIRNAGSTLALCDASKFGRPFKYRLDGFGEVSYVLTDAAPPPALEAAAHRDDCEFLIAGI